jgi:hypothetical protein
MKKEAPNGDRKYAAEHEKVEKSTREHKSLRRRIPGFAHPHSCSGTERSEQTTAELAAQAATGPTSSSSLHDKQHSSLVEFDAAKMKTETLWCMTDFIDSKRTHNEAVITVVNVCPREKSENQ